MVSLDNTVTWMYEDCRRSFYTEPEIGAKGGYFKYVEVPLDSEVVDVPLFMMYGFDRMTQKLSDSDNYSALVARIAGSDSVPRYKSVARYMPEILLADSSTHGMIHLPISDNPNISYYGTRGAVFDCNLNPVMICAWKVGRSGSSYFPILPILYMDADSYLRQEDSIEKFLVRKLLPAVIENPVSLNTDQPHYVPPSRVRVEIGKIPITVRGVETPSISTTNESLLQLAMDHVEEFAL